MSSKHLILCPPFFLLPLIFLSIRVFSNESVHHPRWPKYWSFSASINPSNEYSGLISFRNDWFDLLAVQGTLKSLLQHRSSWVARLLLKKKNPFTFNVIVQKVGFMCANLLFNLYMTYFFLVPCCIWALSSLTRG